MRTAFTLEQLADADTEECDRVLRRCVHCGFCTSVCPTYVLDGNELDSPRGRITLIQHMLETGSAPDAETVVHIDRCLSCLSCQSHCPSGVDYRRLIDHAREYVETHQSRPAPERAARRVLGAVLSSRALFAVALAAGRLVRPFARVMPRALRAPLALIPKHRSCAEEPRSGVVPAQGARRARVGLLVGCVQDGLAPKINDAAIRVLTKLGAEVVIVKGQGCCGALAHHLGHAEDARKSAGRIVDCFAREIEAAGLDRIVATAAGCGTMMKDYGYLFRADPVRAARAEAVAARSADISEVAAVLGEGRFRAPEPMTVAYQSACSLQHGQGLDAEPRRLLQGAGFAVVTPGESHICCGSAGVYNLLQPEIAGRLRDRKAIALALATADVIVSGNIGCMTQLRPALDRPVVHTVEMLDWALGGPRPEGLGVVS